jgi:aerobic-type carbon monoxide dehydrogenase small subunit (CoxS/CutS family)
MHKLLRVEVTDKTSLVDNISSRLTLNGQKGSSLVGLTGAFIVLLVNKTSNVVAGFFLKFHKILNSEIVQKHIVLF